MFMNTQDKGDLSRLMIAGRLMKRGYKLAEPIGENHRFDLIFYDAKTSFKTVQCKTGRFVNGAVCVPLYSVVRNSTTGKAEKRSYRGQIDFICAYCSETDTCYMVPEVGLGTREVVLRVSPPKVPSPNIRWAKEYVL